MPTPEVNRIMTAQLTELYERHRTFGEEPASYYPPEMEAEKHRFGMAVNHVDGSLFEIGDSPTTRSRCTRSPRC